MYFYLFDDDYYNLIGNNLNDLGFLFENLNNYLHSIMNP